MQDDLPRLDLLDRLAAVIDFVTASHRRVLLALIACSLVCFLQGISALPPTNRDESRNAQITKQMFESGDFIDIRYQEAAHYRKPIGIYWLQAASVLTAEAIGFKGARYNILSYRIPSLIAAVVSVLLTYWTALTFMRRRYAFFAALAMAVSIILGVEARIATVDASLLVTAIAAQGALARFYLFRERLTDGQQWKLAVIFWTAIACAALLKGPIIPGIVALTAVTLVIADRSARWLLYLKFIPGLLWVVLLTMPWLIATYLKTSGNFDEASVGVGVFSKFMLGAEGNVAPPGYYFLLFWIALFPAAQLVWLAVTYSWKNRADLAVRFLLAWLMPAWLMFEIIITKLPHYILPVLPSVVILIALALDRGVQSDRNVQRGGWFWPIVTTAIMVALVVMVYQFDGRFGRTFLIFGVLSILLSFAALRVLVGKSAERGLAVALLASAALEISAYSTLPRIKGLFIAPRLVAAARSAPCPNPRIASTLNDPSMVFLGGTDTELTRGDGAADFLLPGGCRVALLISKQEQLFAHRAAQIGLNYKRIGTVTGINYPGFRTVEYLVLMPSENR